MSATDGIERAMGFVVDYATADLQPHGQVELQGVAILGAAAGIGAVTVGMTEDHHYQLTVEHRGGPAVGLANDIAQGTVMATLGDNVTCEYADRTQLAHALTGLVAEPWKSFAEPPAHPVRWAVNYGVDAAALADPGLAEFRGSAAHHSEMSFDWKTGHLVQRQELSMSEGGAFLLQGGIGQTLKIKAERDGLEVNQTARLAIEQRFEVSPELKARLADGRAGTAELVHGLLAAQRIGGPVVVGTASASVGGLGVTARREMPLAELAGQPLSAPAFFDPRKLRYTVEAARGGQVTALGGAGPVHYKLIASEHEPRSRREDLGFDEVREALAQAFRAW